MENTIENKEKFIVQYWGQNIMIDTDNSRTERLYPIQRDNMYRIECVHLNLKPLSSITDEDAKDYLHSIGCYSNELRIAQAKSELQDEYDDIYKTDFLRSKGYALEWMGLRVEDLVRYGWIKLKTD